MTSHPVTVAAGSPMADAVSIMAGRKISELPVVDVEGRPVGLVDVTDVVAILPKEPPLAASPRSGPFRPGCRIYREPE